MFDTVLREERDKYKKDLQKACEQNIILLNNRFSKHNEKADTIKGVFSEDVDKIILGLEDEISNLTKDNMKLKEEYNKAKANEMSLQTEYQALKMQMSLAEYPDASMEQASAIFDRVPTLSGRDPSGGSNVPVPKPNKISTPLKLKVAGGDNPPQKDEPTTFSNLIKPRNKNKGE